MNRPRPRPVSFDGGYWENAAEGVLAVQRCAACGAVQHYPRPVCVQCRGERLEWIPCTGAGTIYSYTVVRVPLHPGFREDVPIVLADVELTEGVRVLARVPGSPVDLPIGARVEVAVAPAWPDGPPLPQARLLSGGAS